MSNYSAGSEVDDPPTERSKGSRSTLPEPLRLLVLSGADRGRELTVGHGRFIVGKHASCSLVLTDSRVSRRHLELRIDADGVHLSDLQSLNGSFFRGGRFSSITVQTGAVITIGGTDLTIVAGDAAEPMLPSAAESFGELRGRSLAMRGVYAMLERVAPSNALVLIEGETGTGKELCAEAIHRHSDRADGPFVISDMSAIARTLIESELFGHTRGAFTGAERDRPGAFEAAQGGTLFLDEIGELGLESQPRLLRAIEKHEISRVGETRHRTVDVRIVAATNRDLAAEVKAGRFRQDLFHRLSVVRVKLPPLRERKEDLPILAETLGARHGATLGGAALARLAEYGWPGNVRELANVIERAAAVTSPGQPIEPGDLGLRYVIPDAMIEDFYRARERVLDEWEQAFLRRMLTASGQNISRASRQSGLARTHLYRLLKKHNLVG